MQTWLERHLEAVYEVNGDSGFVLLWDGLGSHRAGRVVSFCVDLGVGVLYFPAYSPELKSCGGGYQAVEEVFG